jgi:hypothetical protein
MDPLEPGRVLRRTAGAPNELACLKNLAKLDNDVDDIPRGVLMLRYGEEFRRINICASAGERYEMLN